MCFTKSKSVDVKTSNEPQEIVQRKEADASLTKSAQNDNLKGMSQNYKTTALGLVDDAETEQKRLLGE